MADDYPYGSANTTPHIHRYSGGDCHLKIATGTKVSRFDLIEGGRRVKQSRLNEAYDVVRDVYPLATNATRVGLLAAMSGLLRNATPHSTDIQG
ncbi:hypothetical protein [Tropicimonas sp. IMCC6043]|uniref:hypothetical protein n=1 Tax=Tropicimonas sp. IMCC6043 TaxID=2510645 RepID=UPI00101B87A8|nr:hypothetical protein [Tropicimonas sp. IMCC6043]RYH10665.1 hypothetical protein EU800_07970 [Tropicimonas sp. IMCC6043]